MGFEIPKLFVVFLVTAAVTGGSYFLLIHQPQQAIAQSEPVDGRIVSTGVEEVQEDEGVNYRPVVRYEYEYENTDIDGNNIKPGPGYRTYDSRSKAEDVIDDYEEGEEVTVYVDPDEPTKSFLIKKGPSMWAYGFVGFFGLFAVGTFVSFLRSIVGLVL